MFVEFNVAVAEISLLFQTEKNVSQVNNSLTIDNSTVSNGINRLDGTLSLQFDSIFLFAE